MKQFNQYIQEKLKINETSFMLEKLKITKDTKINIYDNRINSLEDFGIKYDCKVIKQTMKQYSSNELIMNNAYLSKKIKSFFTLDYMKWLALSLKVQQYIKKINNLDKNHDTSINRDSKYGTIEITCRNLDKNIIYGYIRLYKIDNLIQQIILNDKDKEEVDKLLIHILDFITDETI